MTTLRRLTPYLLLLLILLAGFTLRTYNVDWAEGQLPHPDERSTVAFYAPTIHWPEQLSLLLDKERSPMNPFIDPNGQPRSYTYGHFPLYLLAAAGNLATKLAPLAQKLGAPEKYVHMLQIANGSPGFAWVGRVLVAIFDTLTLLYLFLLGKRLWSASAGLLAAAFAAFTVQQIQLSHFFAVDPISATFVVMTLYYAFRMQESGKWSHTLLTGMMAGLAVASKFSAMPVLAAPVLAGLMLSYRQRQQPAQHTPPGWLLAGVTLVVAFFTFFITSPFAVLDWPHFSQFVLKEQGAMARGEADFPFTRQYRGTTPWLYFIKQQILWGMGPLLGVAGWLAFVWAGLRALRGRASAGVWLLLSWLVPYFLITGSFLAKFNRYMAPMDPLLSLLAAGMLWVMVQGLGGKASSSRFQSPTSEPEDDEGAIPMAEPIPAAAVAAPERRARHWFWGIGLMVLIPTLLWALAFVNGVYRHEHPFISASKWLYATAPDGSTLITEHWEEGMPLNLPIPGGYPAAHGWNNVTMPMYEEDTPQKFETIKQNMREGDYYILATKRLYGALPHLPQRYPMSIKFYQLLFDGKLGYKLAGDFHTYPQLFGIEIPDQSADESFWVYDHPRTLIFKKERDLSDEEWDALLGGLWEQATPYYTGQKKSSSLLGKLTLGLLESKKIDGPEKKPEKNLLLAQPVNTLPDVGRIAWNPLRESSLASAFIWWLALLALQWLAWPISFALFRHFGDGGYGFARAVGLILMAWISWMLAATHMLINNVWPYLAALMFLVMLAREGWRWQQEAMRDFWQERRGLIWAVEGVFSGAFLLFLFIRLLNPDLWQPWFGGEKFMEFAFFNAVLKTPTFPPYDPYFAHGIMNYYYYGYQILAVPTKLTGLKPTIVFNLAIPTLFALTATGAFSLTYTLAAGLRRRTANWRANRGAGLLGAVIVALMSNLEGGLVLFRQLAQVSPSHFQSGVPGLTTLVRALAALPGALNGNTPLPPYNFWDISRVLPFTINEFPFWSYLFADFHPHMIGIPFTLLFLALAYALVVSLNHRKSAIWPILLTLPLVLGAIGAINLWDLPTYLGIGLLAWLLGVWLRDGRIRVLPGILFLLYLGAAPLLLYRPFFSHYTTVFNTGVAMAYAKTDAALWLRLWGFFIFVAISYALITFGARPGRVPLLEWLAGLFRHDTRSARFLDFYEALIPKNWLLPFSQGILLLIALLGGLLLKKGYTVIALLLMLVAVISLFLFRRSAMPDRRKINAADQFVAALFFTGLLILLGVEIVYLKDFLCGCGEGFFSKNHGEWYRMNTLFKFYIQAWVILGVAAGAALPWLTDKAANWWRGIRWAWLATVMILLGLGLIFPILGTKSRVNDRFPGPRPPRTTLDGMAYMSVGQYSWPDGNHIIQLKDDYDAIRWLQENVTGTPVLAEAPASWFELNGQNVGYDYYRAGGLRVASLTGLPTLLGQHQGEQRYGWQVGQREQVAREFWQTTDVQRLRQLIDQLHVTYVYVGQLERTLFSPEQLAKFDALVNAGQAQVVYQNPSVTLYHLGR
jgi:YYY domain-containing protein